MRIAVLGWGSLIWCPGGLHIATRWHKNGPKLPIEFARISGDGRLTLVIIPPAEPSDDQQAASHEDIQVYWALSEFGDLKAARQNLKEREGCNPQQIHSVPDDRPNAPKISATIKESVRNWLPAAQVDAAIWTGLTTNWKEKRRVDFTPQDAECYIQQLEAERDRAVTAFDRAREYVKNAPHQVQTKVRELLRKKGWEDAQLPRILFEEEQ